MKPGANVPIIGSTWRARSSSWACAGVAATSASAQQRQDRAAGVAYLGQRSAGGSYLLWLSSIQSARPGCADAAGARPRAPRPRSTCARRARSATTPITCGSPTMTGARSSAARLARTIVAPLMAGAELGQSSAVHTNSGSTDAAVGGELRGRRPRGREQVPPRDRAGEQAQPLALRAPGAAGEAGRKRMRVVEERGAPPPPPAPPRRRPAPARRRRPSRAAPRGRRGPRPGAPPTRPRAARRRTASRAEAARAAPPRRARRRARPPARRCSRRAPSRAAR